MTVPVAPPSPAPVTPAASTARSRSAATSDGRDLAAMVEELVRAIEDDQVARSGAVPRDQATAAVDGAAADEHADGSADTVAIPAADTGAVAALAAALGLVGASAQISIGPAAGGAPGESPVAAIVAADATPVADGDVAAPVGEVPTTATGVADGTVDAAGEVAVGDVDPGTEGIEPAVAASTDATTEEVEPAAVDATTETAEPTTGTTDEAGDVDAEIPVPAAAEPTGEGAAGEGGADTAQGSAADPLADGPDVEPAAAGTDAAADDGADAAGDGLAPTLTTTATDVASTRLADAAGAVTATSSTSPTSAVDATSPATAPTRAGAPAVPEQLVSVLAPLREGPDGTHRVAIQLSPGDLGDVQVEVLVRGNEISLHLRADVPGTSDLLRSTLHELRAELEANGFRPGDLDVTGNGPGASADERTAAGGSPTGGVDADAALDDARTTTATTGTASAAGLDLRL